MIDKLRNIYLKKTTIKRQKIHLIFI